MLLDECDRAAGSGGVVDIALGQPVEAVAHDGTQFRVTRGGRAFTAPRLIVATGGPSIPKMGATGYAYDLARQFALKVVEPRPDLVPLTLGGEETLFRSLSGVASEVVARAGKTRFREAALFTHRGLSGPAILQVSSYWRHGEAIGIDFLPDCAPDWLVTLKRSAPRTSPRRALGQHLPDRLAETLAERLALPAELGAATDKLLAAAQGRLADWTFHPNGSEGYAKAEVTVGGVSTAGLSSRTMEAKAVPGLHFVGEAVDVTCWLGGDNFPWALASGRVAGEAGFVLVTVVVPFSHRLLYATVSLVH